MKYKDLIQDEEFYQSFLKYFNEMAGECMITVIDEAKTGSSNFKTVKDLPYGKFFKLEARYSDEELVSLIVIKIHNIASTGDATVVQGQHNPFSTYIQHNTEIRNVVELDAELTLRVRTFSDSQR